jgi:hypothetical protein
VITAIYTFEGVRDPSEDNRGLKRMLVGLEFTEQEHGIEAKAANGVTILVPWSNVAYAMLEPKVVSTYSEPPKLPVAHVVTQQVAPIPQQPPKLDDKRGPGRPRKNF